MLFQRLYNWIKYKTLPPSFLFKNRLFLERDSKHRRIFSNFGLNFRSSKWSSYDTYNIKLKSRTLFTKYVWGVSLFLSSLIIFYFYQKYYISLHLLNNLAFVFWVIIDSFDYYLSFIIWLVIGLVSSLFNYIYSYFFFNNFSKKESFWTYRNISSYHYPLTLPEVKLSSSKSDLNWLVYSWLTNGTASEKANVIEHLFETSVNKNWWLKNYNFFPQLYNSLYSINKLELNTNLFTLSDKISQKLTTRNLFDTNSLLLVGNTDRGFTNSDLLLYFYVKSNQFENSFRNFDNVSKGFKNWEISFNSADDQEYSFLIKSREGLFFLDGFNYNKFNNMFANFSEFWSINFYIKNQLNVSKWNRWLYRYSILHRKVLKNSHKLTLTKRLISSGFYDNNLFNKNIWSSEHFSKFSKENSFFNLVNSSYQSVLGEAGTSAFVSKSTGFGSNTSDQKKKLLNLSFYENSYFWFLKRFYLFNTLPANIIKSKTTINSNYEKFLNEELSYYQNSSINQYSLVSSNLLKSSLHLLSLFEKKIISNPKNFSFETPSSELNYFSKDIYALLSETDLLSKDNLTLLFWISSTTSASSTNSYLRILSKNPLSTYIPPYPVFVRQSPNFLENFNLHLFYLAINPNQSFLKDLNYLTLFY